MKNTIKSRYHHLIIDLFSFTILDRSGCFINGIITHLVLNTLERRHLFRRSFLWRIILPYLLDKLCPRYIFYRTLYCIYIFTSKHLKNISKIFFSLVSRTQQKIVPVVSAKVSLTILDLFACFIVFIIARWIENRCFFLHSFLWQFLLSYLLDKLCPQYIKLILSYIYIKHIYLKNFTKILFSLVTKCQEKIIFGISELVSQFIKILFSLVTKCQEKIIFGISELVSQFIRHQEIYTWVLSFYPSDDPNSITEVIVPLLCLYVIYCMLTSQARRNKAAVKEEAHVIDIKDVRIKSDELTHVMERICLPITKEGEQMKDCMGYEEFDALFQESEPSLDEVKEAFYVFDQNKDGLVDARDLQRVLTNLGLRKSTNLDACKRMIAHYDRNGDGYIDLIDFSRLLEMCFFRKS